MKNQWRIWALSIRCRAPYLQDQEKAVPGHDISIKQKVLNVGTSMLESFGPVKKICQHVCAFHFYAHDMSRQVRAECHMPRHHARNWVPKRTCSHDKWHLVFQCPVMQCLRG